MTTTTPLSAVATRSGLALDPARTSAKSRPKDERRSAVGDVLFRSTVTAPAWLVLRLWLGYQWFHAGFEKLTADGPASWFGDAPALGGFVQGANAIWDNRAQAFGHPNVHYGWFVDFLDFVARHGWFFGPVVVVSELVIGLGLLTGTLTRWAAVAAVSLNLMYVMGGSAGVNGVFLVIAVLLVAAWRVAGHLGGDGLRFGTLRRSAR
jgi:thiosulfate dehydrogenase [quinone] large subunit